MLTKEAALSARAQLLAAGAGATTAGAGGFLTGRKAQSEKKRIKMWRGEDGAFLVVRAPKEKNAFDEKLQACLVAGGQDPEKVAEAFEVELEKISSATKALLMGGGALAEGLFSGAGRALGFTARAAKNVARDALPDAARAAGKGVAAARTVPGAVAQRAGAAASTVGAAAQKLRAGGQAVRTNVSQNFRAGLSGKPVGQVAANDAQQAAQAQRYALAAPKPAAAPTPAPTAAPTGPSPAPAQVQMAGGQPGAAPGAVRGPAAGTPPTGTPGPAAAPAPNLLQQAQQNVMQRYNLGALQGQGMSAQGVGQWFEQLNPQQKAELAAMMGFGAGTAGFAAGAAT